MNYPKKKDQYDLIGREVRFTAEYYRHYGKRSSSWRIMDNPGGRIREGKIVGFGCTYNGRYEPASYGEPPYFTNTKRVPHIKVRIKGEGKELFIPPNKCKLKRIHPNVQ